MAPKLTAETLLSLPRPGAATPNASGSFFVQPYSHFDFNTGRTTRSVSIGKVPRSNSASSQGKHEHSPVVDFLTDLSYGEAVWVDDETVIYLRPCGAEVGKPDVDTELSDKAFKAKLSKDDEQKPGMELWCKTLEGISYKIGQVPVEITNLKSIQTSSSKALLAFSAEVYPEDPSLDSVETLDKEYEEKKNGSEVLVYDKLFVRHWDKWTSEKKKLVFYVELEKSTSASSTSDDLDNLDIQSLPSTDDEDELDAKVESKPSHWSISGGAICPLAGFENIECPVGPFGDKGDFDLSPSHLVFVSKDPHLPEAWHTTMNVYLVPLRPRNDSEKKPKCLTSMGGARSSPVFSASAKQKSGGSSGSGSAGKIAWLEMRKDGYESDRNRIMIYDLDKDVKYGISENWDRSPTSLVWGEDDSTLFAAAEDEGHKKLFVFDLSEASHTGDAKSVDIEPRMLTTAHNVSAYSVLPTIVTKDDVEANKKHSKPANTHHLLLTMNSLVSPNEAFKLTVPSSPRESTNLEQVSNISTALVNKLDMDRGEEFWFSGAAPDKQVHGFLLRPHGYEKGKKYGLAFLVHGGPQSAWTDSWSTRWNPNVFAAKGYVVVAINPTGSTGYGQEFTDAINQEWGGKPFKDLVAGLEFVKRAYGDMIDEERMAMLGGSYGGYMVNWCQGHNDVTKFKAFVCHDGILNVAASYFSTEELYFAEHDLGGKPWEVPEHYEKWSPHNHIRNWSTPELIIHGGLDYRLPDTEGLGVFSALQRKGVPSKLVYFPKENHWVLNPYNSRKWNQEVLGWLEEWIGTGPTVA